jgi:hypothetical protein
MALCARLNFASSGIAESKALHSRHKQPTAAITPKTRFLENRRRESAKITENRTGV